MIVLMSTKVHKVYHLGLYRNVNDTKDVFVCAFLGL